MPHTTVKGYNGSFRVILGLICNQGRYTRSTGVPIFVHGLPSFFVMNYIIKKARKEEIDFFPDDRIDDLLIEANRAERKSIADERATAAKAKAAADAEAAAEAKAAAEEKAAAEVKTIAEANVAAEAKAVFRNVLKELTRSTKLGKLYI